MYQVGVDDYLVRCEVITKENALDEVVQRLSKSYEYHVYHQESCWNNRFISE